MSHPRRFFSDESLQDLTTGATVTLSKSDSIHATKVLRLQNGAEIFLIDKTNNLSVRAVISSDSDPVKAVVKEILITEPSPSRVSTLIFGLCKGQRNDWAVEKSCELGVQRIVLWQTEHSQMRFPDSASANSKIERWQRLAESAIKQSRQSRLPEIMVARSFEELEQLNPEMKRSDHLGILCSLDPQAVRLPLNRLRASSASVAIGPEGDFTEAEEEFLIKLGFARYRLIDQVLRSETAALAAIAIVNHLLTDS